MSWAGISLVVLVCLVILFTLLGTLVFNKKNYNGYFLACGSNISQIGYSDDGSYWYGTQHDNGDLPFGLTGSAYNIERNNGIWVAVGAPGGERTRQIIWSDGNGKIWSDSTGDQFSNDSSASGSTLAYGNGVWVAGGTGGVASGTTLLYSNDGKAWTTVNDSPFGDGEGSCAVVQYLNGRFLAGGKGSAGSTVKIWSSTNGVDWTAATGTPFGTNTSANPTKFAYGNGVYVAVGLGSNNTIWKSSDGQTWSENSSSPYDQMVTMWDVRFSGGLFVTVSEHDPDNNGPIVAWSTDGDTWTAGTGTGTLSTGYFMDNILTPDLNSGKWLIGGGTGSNGLAFYSTDGKSWTQVTDTLFPGGDFKSSASGWVGRVSDSDKRYLAVGSASGSQNVYYSSDRVNWTQATSIFGSGTGNTIDQVRYG